MVKAPAEVLLLKSKDISKRNKMESLIPCQYFSHSVILYTFMLQEELLANL